MTIPIGPPEGARSGFVRRPGGGVQRYRIRGGGDPLLLCAGTGYPLDTWPETFLEPLAHHFRVIEFDYRGTGGTPDSDGSYSTRGFAEDAVALLDALAIDRCHVVGHSMGGRVAQWIAVDSPERVRGLVLVATGAGEGLNDGHQEAGVPLSTAIDMVEFGFRGYLQRNIRRLFFPPKYLEEAPETCESLVEAFWMNRPTVRNYLKHVQARQQHAASQMLADIRADTLVLVGDQDTFAGSTGSHVDQSRYLAAHIPDAELRFVAGAAHGVFWHKPVETADTIVTWLTPRGAFDRD